MSNGQTRVDTMKRREKHGMCGTRVYAAWAGMRNRCENSRDQAYHNYGGRGIAVCQQWQTFAAFLSDMGEPGPGQSLDRIDNDLGYSPENCRWADKATQGRNRRTNHPITVDGVTRLLCEWAEITGIARLTIYNRLRLGWTDEQAVKTPLIRNRKGVPRGQKLVEYGSRHGVHWTDTAERAAA
jgi:hypothetical protein